VIAGESNYQKDLITQQENHIADQNNQIDNYKKIELERDGLLKHKELLLQQIAGLQNDKANLEAKVVELEADLASLTG
jgi:chromosome segregation ATPase